MTLSKLGKLLCTPTEGDQLNNKYSKYADETERKGVWLRKVGMNNSESRHRERHTYSCHESGRQGEERASIPGESRCMKAVAI